MRCIHPMLVRSLALMSAGCCAAAALAETPEEPLSTTAFIKTREVPVGQNPHGMAFADGRIYLAAAGDDEIQVFDEQSLVIVDRWPAPHAPLDIVQAAAGWLVTEFRGEHVSIRDRHGRETGRLAVGRGPSLFVAGGPGRDRIYLVSEFADRFTVIDGRKGEILAAIATGKRPYPADVSADGRFALVPNRDENTVSLLDLEAGRERLRIAVCERPEGGALHPDGLRYFVACGGGNEVRVITFNAARDEYETTTRIRDGIGQRPFSVVFSADGRHAFVNNAGGDSVSVVDSESYAVIDEVKVGAIPIVMRRHGDRLYVASEGSHTLSVIAAAVQ